MAKSHYLTWTLLRSAKIPQGLYEPADLAALAEFVLRSEKVLGPVALTLDLTNPDRIQVLNRHFRGVDRTTDVIAFRDEMPSFLQELPSEVSRAGESKNWRVGESENRGAGELRKQKKSRRHSGSPAPRFPDTPSSFAGDIAINVVQTQIQAKKYRHSARRELRLLLIHGTLHLLDYTDYDPIPRRKMFKRQNTLLRAWEKKHP